MRQQNVFAGITAAQQQLIRHWQARRTKAGLVPRESLDPGALRSMLASISIVDMGPDGVGRFRIAGSRLRDIFGMEVRGRLVSEIAGAHGDCYALGLSAALERGEPVGGLIETGGRIHVWLRLPLAGEDGRLSLVLCHDELFASRQALIPALAPEMLVQQPKPRFAA